jgi:predicted phosphodiesterase
MKKAWKKVLALIVVMVFALTPVSLAVTPPTRAEAAHLCFGADKKFTVMQVTDIQDGPGLVLPAARFIKKALDEVKPDLVVLTGDNINGAMSPTDALTAGAIDKFMRIFDKAGVPVAAVFGNHDDEGKTSKEAQMALYMQYDCFIGYDEGPDISGVGTYNVPIYSSTNPQKVAYNIWMIDSGTYDTVNGGYDYVKQDQIDWYTGKSNALKAANGGIPVNSLMFQHIVVPEVYEAFNEVSFGTPGAVAKYGKHFVLNPAMTRAGVLGEGACPPDTNGGQFEAVRAQGDVVAMFFGHDHANTYEVTVRGIDLVCSPTSGMASYGDENRGVRVITVDENDTSSYSTYMVRYTDYFDTASPLNFGYNFMVKFWNIAFPVMKLFYFVTNIFGA